MEEINFSIQTGDTNILVFAVFMLLFDIIGIVAMCVKIIKNQKHKKELIKIFNNGICLDCSGEYEPVESEYNHKFGLYKCNKCGKTIKIDDGDVDFLWNLSHFRNTMNKKRG